MDKSYYQRQMLEDNDLSQDKLAEKRRELELVFQTAPLLKEDKISIAVLGCGDKRHLLGNKKIFEEVLEKEVELTTFDIEIAHLGGSAVKHDCTQSLPGKFDITYAHVLLKFIKPEKQIDLIKNSFNALNDGGLAIHVLDEGDKEVDINSIISFLEKEKIKYVKIPLKYGFALVLIK